MESKATTLIVRYMVGNYYVTGFSSHGMSLHSDKDKAYSVSFLPNDGVELTDALKERVSRDVEQIKSSSNIPVHIVVETVVNHSMLESVNIDEVMRRINDIKPNELKMKGWNK